MGLPCTAPKVRLYSFSFALVLSPFVDPCHSLRIVYASPKVFISATGSLSAAASALSFAYPGIILQDTIIMSCPLVLLLHALSVVKEQQG